VSDSELWAGWGVDYANASNLTASTKLRTEPTYKGAWIIGGRMGVTVMQRQRPRWVTRFLCRLLLEWEWCDGASLQDIWESQESVEP
jgi:hypothetical protein